MNDNNRTNYKRQYRELSQETKDKIRNALIGHKHSHETKQKISQGQKLAWSKIPYRNDEKKSNYTINYEKNIINNEESSKNQCR